MYCTRLLIDDRRSAHGRFARAYKRVVHASMETIAREKGARYLDRPYDKSVFRKALDAREDEKCSVVRGMGIERSKILDGEEAGWRIVRKGGSAS